MSITRRACLIATLAGVSLAVAFGKAPGTGAGEKETGQPTTTSAQSAGAVADGRESVEESAGGGTGTGGSTPSRMREGSKYTEQIGEFQKAGEQVSFYLANRQMELRVLPNLALERVVRVLDDNPAVRTWSVSGVITEYRGDNYLLLTRAVLKARPTQTITRKRRLPEAAEKGE